MALNGRRFLEQDELGDEKVRRLREIFERTLDTRGIGPVETSAPSETLAAWQVPADLPFRLIILPTVMTNHCARRGLGTLAQVLEEWVIPGYTGFLAQKVLGKDSVTPQLRFGGVPLADFLKTQVSVEDREAFSKRLACSSVLPIDDAKGKVFPALTNLRRAVLGLLLKDKKPIPLSRLIRRLIRTGYHTEFTPKMVRQAEWCRLHAFRKNRVLWEK